MKLVQLIGNQDFNPITYSLDGFVEFREKQKNPLIKCFVYNQNFDSIEEIRKLIREEPSLYIDGGIYPESRMEDLERQSERELENTGRLRKSIGKWGKTQRTKELEEIFGIYNLFLDNVGKAKIEIYQPEEASNFIRGLQQQKIPYFQIDVKEVNYNLNQIYSKIPERHS